jgi:hypothetical protein
VVRYSPSLKRGSEKDLGALFADAHCVFARLCFAPDSVRNRKKVVALVALTALRKFETRDDELAMNL